MKKLVFMLAVVCGVIASHAEDDSYLLWMFDTSESSGWDAVQYDEVKIYAKNTSTGTKSDYLTIYNQNDLSTGISVTGTSDTESYATLLSSEYQGSAWSYFVELLNDETPVSLQLDGLSYATAIAQYIVQGPSGVSSPTIPFNFGAQNVPEPNSAMLLLMGLSALALRRKRAAKKA